MSKKPSRYRHGDGKRWIEVRVKSPLQLFDARDPAPFRDRDLDDDFVEYIVASAREFPTSTPFKIVIYLESKETPELPRDSIREAIRSYFAYQVEIQRAKLKRYVRQTEVYLLIGLLVLGICITVARHWLGSASNGVGAILREGVVIFGWVSLWKPLELLLFDWYPLLDDIHFCRRLVSIEIDLHFGS